MRWSVCRSFYRPTRNYMFQIYKCIKSFRDIDAGSIWFARENHYKFKKLGADTYRFITPPELKTYFIKLKEI